MAAPFRPVALVTGASRGIGRAIARQLAARNVRVAVHYHRNRRAAEATLATLPGTGHVLFGADLIRPAAGRQLVGRVLQALGRMDVLVNNAGIYELHPPDAAGFALWRKCWERTLAANLTASARTATSPAPPWPDSASRRRLAA